MEDTFLIELAEGDTKKCSFLYYVYYIRNAQQSWKAFLILSFINFKEEKWHCHHSNIAHIMGLFYIDDILSISLCNGSFIVQKDLYRSGRKYPNNIVSPSLLHQFQ
jgi:hypothetical protein